MSISAAINWTRVSADDPTVGTFGPSEELSAGKKEVQERLEVNTLDPLVLASTDFHNRSSDSVLYRIQKLQEVKNYIVEAVKRLLGKGSA